MGGSCCGLCARWSGEVHAGGGRIARGGSVAGDKVAPCIRGGSVAWSATCRERPGRATSVSASRRFVRHGVLMSVRHLGPPGSAGC